MPITQLVFFRMERIRVKIPQNLRRRHIFIIQSTSTPVNDHVMELVFMIDAAERTSAFGRSN